MQQSLRLIEGVVGEIRIIDEGIVIWYKSRSSQKSIAVKQYLIKIGLQQVRLTSSNLDIQIGDQVQMVILPVAQAGVYTGFALQKDQCLYLNPRLNPDCASLQAMGEISKRAIFIGLILGGWIGFYDFNLGLVVAFSVMAFSGFKTGLRRYIQYVKEADRYLTTLCQLFNLPKVNLFHKRYRKTGHEGIIDLTTLNSISNSTRNRIFKGTSI